MNRTPISHLTSHPEISLGRQLGFQNSQDGLNATFIHLDFIEYLLDVSNTTSPENFRHRFEDVIHQPTNIVMLVLCFFGLCANVGTIVAVCHSGGVHNSRSLSVHLKLIMNLTASILFTIISHLLRMFGKALGASVYNLPVEPDLRLSEACFYAVTSSLNFTSYLIYLFNLSAMAVDHYVAILRPLHYTKMMTNRHFCIIILWILATLGGFINFIHFRKNSEESQFLNYCESVMNNEYKAELLILCLAVASLFVMSFIYLRIFLEVKKMHARAQFCYPHDSLHSNKAVITTVLIMGTFYLCWLPYCSFQGIMLVQLHFSTQILSIDIRMAKTISEVLSILLLTNCLLDPIIYAFRLEVVRKGYKNFVKRMNNRIENRNSRMKVNTQVTYPMLEIKKEDVPDIDNDNINDEVHLVYCRPEL